MEKLIKFLPSYVGSKSHWIDKLVQYRNFDFVELFSGSAIISANLAKTATLNDIDPYIYKIFKNYKELIVPKIFTANDYVAVRSTEYWWKYVFCLQKMSFSGVFRYSKNGYNVPIKKTLQSIEIQSDYLVASKRYDELSPVVLNSSYIDVDMNLLKDKIVILDPPYESSQASYNTKFNYEEYWRYIYYLEGWAKHIIIFDSEKNIPFSNYQTRKMRVNGKYKGDTEAMFIFDKSLKIGQEGEELFLRNNIKYLEKSTDLKYDFIVKETGEKVELKSDYYDMNKTENFFMEFYSDSSRKTLGGPWRAANDNVEYYVYFFPKNNKFFTFNSNILVNKLNCIIKTKKLVSIPNKTWVTQGYIINRRDLEDISVCEDLGE